MGGDDIQVSWVTSTTYEKYKDDPEIRSQLFLLFFILSTVQTMITSC